MSGAGETAYAKVNLALHVRERLPDGYHRIETVFAFCEDGDALTAERSDRLSLELAGPSAANLDREDNLVVRAAKALFEERGISGGANLALDKQLPVAAGLGGGSADAAATLRLLNRIYDLGLPDKALEEISRSLGADVPACVRSVTMRGDGRGDELAPVDLGLSGAPILLANPRVELSTADVFAAWDGADRGPLGDWKEGRNDLEPAASALVPQVGFMLAWLAAQRGAIHVRMSGSGATCFAIFGSEADRDAAAIAVPREWWHLATRLR